MNFKGSVKRNFFGSNLIFLNEFIRKLMTSWLLKILVSRLSEF